MVGLWNLSCAQLLAGTTRGKQGLGKDVPGGLKVLQLKTVRPQAPAAFSLEGKCEQHASMDTPPPLYKLHTPKPRPAPSSVFLAELGKEGINLTAPGLTVRIYISNPWATFTTSIFLLICQESLAVMCKCFLSSE